MIDLKKIDVTEIEHAIRHVAERATQAVREQAEGTLAALRETVAAAESMRGRAVERLVADALTATVKEFVVAAHGPPCNLALSCIELRLLSGESVSIGQWNDGTGYHDGSRASRVVLTPNRRYRAVFMLFDLGPDESSNPRTKTP